MELVIQYFIGVLTLLNSIPHVASLQCYACTDAGTENECLEFTTFAEAMDGKRPGVLKNCTAPYDQVCFIETYSNNGMQISHIRDCGDGVHFSFNPNGTSNFDRLNKLGTDNETACVFDGKQNQICLTKCNSTDFCNGPLVSDVSAANVFNASGFLLSFGLFILGVARYYM